MADPNKVLQQFLEKTVDKMENVAVELGYDLADRIMIQSPVYTGQYKASFRANVNVPDTTAEPPRDRKMREGPGRPGISIGGVGDGGEIAGRGGVETDAMYNQVYLDFDADDSAIYISNSTPYAGDIEFTQLAATSPEGVMLVAYEAFKGSINQIIARAIQEN